MLREYVPVCYADAVADSEAPVPDYSEDGVDLSLIRWMLSLTPAERLTLAYDLRAQQTDRSAVGAMLKRLATDKQPEIAKAARDGIK